MIVTLDEMFNVDILLPSNADCPMFTSSDEILNEIGFLFPERILLPMDVLLFEIIVIDVKLLHNLKASCPIDIDPDETMFTDVKLMHP